MYICLGQWEIVTIRLMDELLSPLKRGTILARTVADLIEINFFPLGITRYCNIMGKAKGDTLFYAPDDD